MSPPSVLYAQEKGIARITLNRPDRLNSFTEVMHGELRAALDQAARSAQVIVLTARGAASARARTSMTERLRPVRQSISEQRSSNAGTRWCGAWQACPSR